MTIYKQIEREKWKKILKRVEDIEKRYEKLSDSQATGKMLDELLEIINLAHNDKIMFGMPYELVHSIISDEEKNQAAKGISLIALNKKCRSD
ncbi:MAG: hypothetical protein ACR5K6_04995 [Wolbachia sp.]